MTLLKKLFRKKESKEKLVSVLDEFIQQIYWGENLNPEESKKNIEESVLEITENGRHLSNGFLITNNGYFLTARHCVENPKGLTVRHNNKFYELKVCAKGKQKENDLALVKIDIKEECEIKKYKFEYNKLENMPITLISRIDGKIIRKYGLATKNNPFIQSIEGIPLYLENHFIVDYCDAKGGDSGGPTISKEGKVIGINIASNRKDFCVGVDFIKALELIHFYKEKIKKKI